MLSSTQRDFEKEKTETVLKVQNSGILKYNRRKRE
jgi:hypothetical protein